MRRVPARPNGADRLAPGLPRPARIHIVGGSGTGKTTLAALLGRLLDVPVYHLDAVARSACDDAGRREAAAEIAGRHRWVTEGIYLGWSEPLFEVAELIVWLDADAPRAVFGRVVVRFVGGSLAETRRRGLKGALRFASYARHLREFAGHLREVRRYYTAPAAKDTSLKAEPTKEATAAYVARWACRTVRCARPRDVAELLARLEELEPSAAAAPTA